MVGSVIIGLDSIWLILVDDFSFQIEFLQMGLCFLWVDLDSSLFGFSLFDSIFVFYLLVELSGDYGSCIDLLFVDDLLECLVFWMLVGEVVFGIKGGVVCCLVFVIIVGLILREDDDFIVQVCVDC